MLMNIPFHSDEAKKINILIFETIYHSALETSCELAEKEGEYETFRGCPASEGLLQFDLWGKEPIPDRYDWKLLKENILKHGLRNSLLVAPMPTASTSQILGFNECLNTCYLIGTSCSADDGCLMLDEIGISIANECGWGFLNEDGIPPF